MPLVKLSWLAFEFYLTLLSYLLVSLFYNLQAVYKERKFIKKSENEYCYRLHTTIICETALYFYFVLCILILQM